jgi:hypothetical protein
MALASITAPAVSIEISTPEPPVMDHPSLQDHSAPDVYMIRAECLRDFEPRFIPAQSTDDYAIGAGDFGCDDTR